MGRAISGLNAPLVLDGQRFTVPSGPSGPSGPSAQFKSTSAPTFELAALQCGRAVRSADARSELEAKASESPPSSRANAEATPRVFPSARAELVDGLSAVADGCPENERGEPEGDGSAATRIRPHEHEQPASALEFGVEATALPATPARLTHPARTV